MKKIFLLILLFPTLTIYGFFGNSYQDLEDFLSYQKKKKDLSYEAYEKKAKDFIQEYSQRNILTPLIKRDSLYFLIKEGKSVIYANYSLKDIESVFKDLLKDELLDKQKMRDFFQNIIYNKKKEGAKALVPIFSLYVKTEIEKNKEDFTVFIDEWMKKDPDTGFFLGTLFYETTFYSFSDRIMGYFSRQKQDSKIYFYLGLSAYKQYSYENAIRHLKKYLKLNPKVVDEARYTYYMSLWQNDQKQKAYKELGNFCKIHKLEDYCYRFYLFSNALYKENKKSNEDAFIKRFPKDSRSLIIQRRRAIEKIRQGDKNGLEELRKILSYRKDYLNVIEAAFFKPENLEEHLKSSQDLLYIHVLSHNNKNPYPEIYKNFPNWQKEDLQLLENFPENGDIKKFNLPWILGNDGIRSKLFYQKNDFFKSYSTVKLDFFYKNRVRAFCENNFENLILQEIQDKFKNDEVKKFAWEEFVYEKTKNMGAYFKLFYKKIPREQEKIAPKFLLKKLYPKPYEDIVSKSSEKYGIPKEFVYAIMRTESHFTPTAVSPAGALGLMQLMPFVAKEIYNSDKSLSKYPYNPKDPELNIMMGVKHLASLYKRLNGNLILTAISYNAGYSRAQDWSKYIEDDNWLQFVLLIPFDETQFYLHKVFRDFEMYKILYSRESLF